MTAQKGTARGRNVPMLNVGDATFVFQGVKTVVDALYQNSEEVEEGACGDVLCLECWLKLPKCNFCNKPYCKQHTNWWCTSSDSSFLCKVCDENSHGYTYNDVL